MNKKMKAAVGIIAVGSLALALGTAAMAGTNFKNGLGTNVQRNQAVTESSSTTTDVDQNAAFSGRGHGKGQGKEGLGAKGAGMAGMAGMAGAHGDMGLGKGGHGAQLDTAALQTAGLLTAAQVTAIDSFIATHEAEETTERATVDAMTSAERQAYFDKQATTVRTTLQQDLVSNKILTQTEMDKIDAYMEAQMLEQRQTELTTALAPFVTDGTINQKSADAILAYMKALEVKHEADEKALVGKTEAEVQAFFAANPKVDPLTSMVTDKVITQAQADALASVLNHGGHGGNGGHGGRGMDHQDDVTTTPGTTTSTTGV